MAGVRSKPLRSGKYRAWFIDHTGEQRHFTGTRNKTQTRRIAERLEDEHRQIRLGYTPRPHASEAHARRPVQEVMAEYLAWGQSQGGRGGRAWSVPHARKRQTQLDWWNATLGLKTLEALSSCLPHVEAALRTLQQKGRAGKTVANYADTLHAFCRWCVDHEYLATDPLAKLKPFDTTPLTTRRALSVAEIQHLLAHCPLDQQLLLETAFCSGLRAGELRRLTPHHLDANRGGLRLDSAWTKNRKHGFQPLPAALVAQLRTWSTTDEAHRLYAINYERANATGDYPADPLLYVPSNPARSLDRALRTAEIPKVTPAGKIDFHACRVAYITMLFEGSASLKEAQELARHLSPQLTANVYARVRDDRLAMLVQGIGEAVAGTRKHAHNMHGLATGTEDGARVGGMRECRRGDLNPHAR
jgi:integrase